MGKFSFHFDYQNHDPTTLLILVNTNANINISPISNNSFYWVLKLFHLTFQITLWISTNEEMDSERSSSLAKSPSDRTGVQLSSNSKVWAHN